MTINLSLQQFREAFLGFMVLACFVVGVFIAPLVCAWSYMDRRFEGQYDRDAGTGRTFVDSFSNGTKVKEERVASFAASADHPGAVPRYEVTFYSHGCTLPRSGPERPPQKGADGRWPESGLTVAADTSLHPFGTELLIAGLGFRTVGDRGHAIKGRRLDVFVDSCSEARKFGRQWLSVSVVPPESTRFADGGGW